MVAVAVAPAPEETEETDAADDSDASDGDDASERVVSLALATRTPRSGGSGGTRRSCWRRGSRRIQRSCGGAISWSWARAVAAVGLIDATPLRTGAVACAALGARHVALTDFDAGVVELLKENARNNYLRAGCDCYEL